MDANQIKQTLLAYGFLDTPTGSNYFTRGLVSFFFNTKKDTLSVTYGRVNTGTNSSIITVDSNISKWSQDDLINRLDSLAIGKPVDEQQPPDGMVTSPWIENGEHTIRWNSYFYPNNPSALVMHNFDVLTNVGWYPMGSATDWAAGMGLAIHYQQVMLNAAVTHVKDDPSVNPSGLLPAGPELSNPGNNT